MSKVLIVDDSSFDRHLAKTVLESDPHLIVEAVDGGVAALDRLSRGGIDLVVTDMQMPVIDGIQLVMNIREDYPEVPVILMTGEGSELVAMEALTHGAVNYVPKRMMKEWLSRTVYEALSAQKVERTHQEILDVATYSEMRLQLTNTHDLIKAVLQIFEQTAAGILDCPKSDVVRLGIAVKEAIEHALKINSRIEFEYVMQPFGCKVTLRTQEDGKTIFDPGELPQRLAAETLESEEGRGFFLIRSHLDEVQINESGREAVLIINVSNPHSTINT